ncbi:uncharacterized protein [Rutidosis leptorrhynchoides]|uniref:uncharacterized protein n=1 Tax=Rutidosis leptorrhynchoides TaxID=125765 RepID=UPI003A9A327D
MEELEALSNHYALLFNRRKAKLSTEEKSASDIKLKEVQQMLSLDTVIESEKGKNIENISDNALDEIKSFHSSSVYKYLIWTGGKLDSLYSEGVHRLSEMCCIAVSQLLIIGKSVIQYANKGQNAVDDDEDIVKLDWPEDSIEKAKTIKMKTQLMTEYLEAVAVSFVTGISDVAETYAAAIKSAATADSNEVVPEKSVEGKVKLYSEDLNVNQTTAVGKIQDDLHFLAYVVLSNSMPAA